MKILIIVEKTETGYSAYSPDLPGCAATGSTREEVEREMQEAIEFHVEGMRAVRRTVEASLELGIDHLTLYAFSLENWSRPAQEVGALMRLLNEFVERETEELRERGVRTRVFGDRDMLPPAARKSCSVRFRGTRCCATTSSSCSTREVESCPPDSRWPSHTCASSWRTAVRPIRC